MELLSSVELSVNIIILRVYTVLVPPGVVYQVILKPWCRSVSRVRVRPERAYSYKFVRRTFSCARIDLRGKRESVSWQRTLDEKSTSSRGIAEILDAR